MFGQMPSYDETSQSRDDLKIQQCRRMQLLRGQLASQVIGI